MKNGKVLIAQSGGPTAVINASLVGIIEALHGHSEIKAIYGSRNGLQGALTEDFIDLRRQTRITLERVAQTSGAALGSSRTKPSPEACQLVFDVCRRHNIRYLFYIGGNDSAETADIINRAAQDIHYELRVFHVPKTIDNDLLKNDHTPGYGSAARYVALEFIGMNNDQKSLAGIHIVKVMGRDAGFLAAASVLGKRDERDAPHRVYIPESPISIRGFIEEVLSDYETYGTCVAAVSEGVKTTKGDELIKIAAAELYSKDRLLPKDSFGNVQLSGFGVDGDYLLCVVHKGSDGKARVRTDRLTYGQRTHPTIFSEIDRIEARYVGRFAAEEGLRADHDGSVVIKRTGYGHHYGIKLGVVPLERVAKGTKKMPPRFYDPETKMPTPTFIRYASDLVGPLPEQGRLEDIPVPKID